MTPTLRLSDIRADQPIVDPSGRPTAVLLRTLNGNNLNLTQVLTAIQAALDAAAVAQQAADDAQAAADAAQATADSIVIPPSGSRTVTTSQALLNDDYVVLAETSGGSIVLSLPNSLASESSTITITKVDGSANTVTVQPQGSDQLNGSGLGIIISMPYEQRVFSTDSNGNWYS